MCRSSRFLGFLAGGVLLAATIAAVAPAQARGLAVHFGIGNVGIGNVGIGHFGTGLRPMPVLPRAMSRPDLRFGPHPDLARSRGFGPGRFGRGYGGYGGYDVGLDNAGLGLGLAGDALTAPALPYGGEGPAPQWQPADLPPAPRPCVRPLIITIGNGLRHAARTKIVYGARPPCGY